MEGEATQVQPQQPPAELVITLDPPIKFNGGTYDTLALKEPRVRDVQKAEKHLRTVNQEALRNYSVSLVTNVSELPEPVVLALPISQMNKAMQYLTSFIEAGPATGNNSSET